MGMTLRTSDQQTEALRKQAAAEGRSMQAVALSAIDEYIERRTHKAKVAAALIADLPFPADVQESIYMRTLGDKPVALTEYNIFAEGSRQRVSYIAGMHAAHSLSDSA